jgi:predicted transcriptional regulator
MWYNKDMTPKLTNEQSEALHASGDEMQILDPSTNKFYVVVEQSVHQKAIAALKLQEEENLAAIQQGIDDVNAGQIMPADVAHKRIREKLVSRFGKCAQGELTME